MEGRETNFFNIQRDNQKRTAQKWPAPLKRSMERIDLDACRLQPRVLCGLTVLW